MFGWHCTVVYCVVLCGVVLVHSLRYSLAREDPLPQLSTPDDMAEVARGWDPSVTTQFSIPSFSGRY